MMSRKALPSLLLVVACGTPGAPGGDDARDRIATRAARTAVCSRYVVTDLGILPGGGMSAATAIDDDGTVVGSSQVDATWGAQHAFAWTRADRQQDLGTLGGAYSYGYAVSAGRVVGQSDLESGHHAFLYDGALRDLGTLGGEGIYDESVARGINTDGVIVGASRLPSGYQRAVRFEDGEVVDLGTLVGVDASNSEARAINDAGVIVGVSDTLGGPQHATAWVDGSAVDLGAIGRGRSIAVAVNTAGDAAGTVVVDRNVSHPALFRGGAAADLGLLPGFDFGDATGINDDGLVVGTVVDQRGEASPILRGFVSDGVTMVDLDDVVVGSGWRIMRANAINDAGQIVGAGVVRSTHMGVDPRMHALLLTPACEPAPPALRAVSIVVNGTTVEVPDTHAEGDLMLAAVEYCGDPVSLEAPQDWTLIADQVSGQGTEQVFHALLYAHAVTGDDLPRYWFSAPDGVYVDIQVADYGGVSAVDAVASANGFGTSIEAPASSATEPGLRVAFFSDFVGGSWSEALGMTRRTDLDSNSLQDELVSPGPVDARAASNDGEGPLAVISVVLR